MPPAQHSVPTAGEGPVIARRAAGRAKPPSRSSPQAADRARPPSKSSPQAAADATRAHRWLLRGVLLLTPVVLLALLEGTVRLLGLGAPEPLFVPVEVGTLAGYRTNPDVGRRYFAASMGAMTPQPVFQFVPAAKDSSTFRFFVLGGSTAAGFPYGAHGSFGGLLETRLRHLVPGRAIEGVCCAMTAVGSATVRDFTAEVLAHEPDLLILYTGHNEFYGAAGAAAHRAQGGLLAALARAAGGLRGARVLGEALAPLLRPGRPRPDGNVMETMAAERLVAPRSPLREQAVAAFVRNLRAILDLAAGAGVPVLLCDVSSNLRSQPPLASLPGPHATAADSLERTLTSARARLAAGDTAAALERLRRCVAADSHYAEGRYDHAQLLAALGRYPDARPEYCAARDHDALPFRAPSAIHRAIRRAGRRPGVHLFSVDSLFCALSPLAANENRPVSATLN